MNEHDAAARRARRAWLLENHPDHGGDPALFVDGLARESSAGRPVEVRPTVYRSRSIARTARRLFRRACRIVAGRRHGSGRVR